MILNPQPLTTHIIKNYKDDFCTISYDHLTYQQYSVKYTLNTEVC